MAGNKTEHTCMLNEDHVHYLEQMMEQYDLPDTDKVLRVLIDYAMQDGDADAIFETVRCLRC